MKELLKCLAAGAGTFAAGVGVIFGIIWMVSVFPWILYTFVLLGVLFLLTVFGNFVLTVYREDK